MNELKTELYQTSQYHPQTIGEKKIKKTKENTRNGVEFNKSSNVKIDLVLFVERKKKVRKLIGFVGWPLMNLSH